MPDLALFIRRQHVDPQLRLESWARDLLRRAGPTGTLELLTLLTDAIRRNFVYVSRPERGTQDPATTLSLRRGSCRDFAVLMIEALRSLGLAARFVTGYLHIPVANTQNFEGGGHTHAWCEVYLPGAGWIEFDPTNGIIGNANLIRVAVARDPGQALPLSGTFVGKATDAAGMIVSVETKEIHADEILSACACRAPAFAARQLETAAA